MYIVIEIIVGILVALCSIGKVILLIAGIKDPKGLEKSRENKKDIANYATDNLTNKFMAGVSKMFNKGGK